MGLQAPEGDVRAKLYSFQLQIEAAELREGREVDSDALEAILTLARADLHFNPRSHTTWDALAGALSPSTYNAPMPCF